MNCKDCYWCALNHALSDKVVCCNEKSCNYNQLFSKEEREVRGVMMEKQSKLLIIEI